MKYLGSISDPKDIVTKEYVDGKCADLVNQLAAVEISPTSWASSVDTSGRSIVAYYIPYTRKVFCQIKFKLTSDRSAGTAYTVCNFGNYKPPENTDIVCDKAVTQSRINASNGNIIITPSAKIAAGTEINMTGSWSV